METSMDIILLVALLMVAVICPVGLSYVRSREDQLAHHAFYRDGYMREEVDALRTQTQEIPRID
jgi:hypothetical protein